jgi:hypothetical protein
MGKRSSIRCLCSQYSLISESDISLESTRFPTAAKNPLAIAICKLSPRYGFYNICIFSFLISVIQTRKFYVHITTDLSREPYIGARFCAVRPVAILFRIVPSVRLISQAKTVTIGESVSKRLLYCPPIFIGNPIRFGLWNDFRICTAFRYSSLANHGRISTVENRKLRMTVASHQSTNFLPRR